MRKTGPMAKSPLLRKPEPGTFEHLLRPVDVPARSMVRLSRRPLSEPWFGRSASGRFDDPLGQFGVCYAADDTATAFAETILHESALFLGGQYVVMAGDLASRWVVTLRRPKRTKLCLADLTGEALKALGLKTTSVRPTTTRGPRPGPVPSTMPTPAGTACAMSPAS